MKKVKSCFVTFSKVIDLYYINILHIFSTLLHCASACYVINDCIWFVPYCTSRQTFSKSCKYIHESSEKNIFFLDKNAAIIKNIYYLLLNSVSKLDTRMKHRHICQFLSFYEIQVLGTISRKNLQFFCL